MIRKLALVLAAAGLIATAGHVLAQQAGPNGGLVAGRGSHKMELVVTPTEMAVFMLVDGKLHDADGVTLRAIVQQGGKRRTINLVNQKGEKLVAKLAAPLDNGAIVVLTGKDDHGDALNARFVIK